MLISRSLFKLSMLSIFSVLFFTACGSSSDTDGGTLSDETSTGLQLVSVGDFDSSASAAVSALMRQVTTGTCDDRVDDEADDPILADGLDCDDDGGVVAHITPSRYALAFKRVTLIPEDADSDEIDFIADTGTLADSEIVDFTASDSTETVVTIDPTDLSAGTYSGIEAELYYFQMTFPVDGVTRNIRIYMSDDDFTSEGSLGHHQGDITYIDDSGTELGWIGPDWSDDLVTERSEAQNGAGNNNDTNGDPETGHQRGYFGNEELWDREDLMQGADQDIYLFTINFDEPLVIPDPSTIDGLTTITATFSTADTFYYEDFATQGTGWNPAEDGVFDTGEWAPLTPSAELTVD